jgi:hypothetical protein
MPDPNTSPSITREQAILIASRVIVVYLLFWVIDDLTLLPRVLFSVAHYMRKTGSVLGTNTSLPETSNLLHYYIQELLGIVLRMTLWLMAAGWFYRCGPRIRDFFAAGTE